MNAIQQKIFRVILTHILPYHMQQSHLGKPWMVAGFSLSSIAFPRDNYRFNIRQGRRATVFSFPLFVRASVVMCAWFCSGRSNTELVHRLRASNVITSERVKEVRAVR
jgi:hypothetical protein